MATIIIDRFVEVEYEVKTIDGSSYKFFTIEELIGYSNPDERRIVQKEIRAEKEKGGSGLYPSFSLTLFDTSQKEVSMILNLHDLDEVEITFLNQRLSEFAERCKISYRWIHTILIYYIIGGLLYAGVLWLFDIHMKKNDLAGASVHIFIVTVISCLCMLTSLFGIKKLVEYIYPKGGIVIGEQKELMMKRKWWRNLLCISVILATIIGVVSGLIVEEILN